MFLQSYTGVNVMTYYSPRIFETLGVTGTSTKLFSTGVYGIVKTAGMFLFAFWVVESVGRRRGLIWGSFLGAIPLFYVGGYIARANPIAAAAAGTFQQTGWGYLAMVCIYVNAFIICATWQGITWTYAAEIFPLDIRMFCVACCTASTWLGSFIVARATPYMITDLGFGTFFMFGGFVILMGLWAFFCVPETKGQFTLSNQTHTDTDTDTALRCFPRGYGRPLLEGYAQGRLGSAPRQEGHKGGPRRLSPLWFHGQEGRGCAGCLRRKAPLYAEEQGSCFNAVCEASVQGLGSEGLLSIYHRPHGAKEKGRWGGGGRMHVGSGIERGACTGCLVSMNCF